MLSPFRVLPLYFSLLLFYGAQLSQKELIMFPSWTRPERTGSYRSLTPPCPHQPDEQEHAEHA